MLTSCTLPVVMFDKLLQVASMVEQQMQFDGAFGTPKFGPVKHTQTQFDECGVKAQQLVLELKFVFS